MDSDNPLPSRHGLPVYTVSQLNQEARGLLEGRIGRVWVEGEIGNLSQPSSGHAYFTLKDARAQVRCALFRSARPLCCALADGMQVLVGARVSLYEARGDFQLIVEQMEDAGEGALRRAFEALKRTLAAEGLFEARHKKPLPAVIRRIGVLTSPDGAVWHDIVTTLRRRFPAIAVLLYPIPVQGREAGVAIARMLDLANERRECDVLLLARGGGSLEDLWCFNEEIVARAIFRSQLPVVAGIGHETDTTIADWVADLRAPTPTAGAELLSPDQALWRRRHAQARDRLQRLLERMLRERVQQFDDLKRRLIMRSVRGIPEKRQGVAGLVRRLVMALPSYPARARARLAALSQRLERRSPIARLQTYRVRLAPLPGRLAAGAREALHTRERVLARLNERLKAAAPDRLRERLEGRHSALKDRLQRAMQDILKARAERVALLDRGLTLTGPPAVLNRGYAIVTDDAGHVARDARAYPPGTVLHVRLAEGEITVEVLANQP
ncbi:exodeoxyribonuclease VII large subunit [Acidiferrobacter sp.]|uniref:exodeoxyribonuclease VII large subunit n=1 Tax=Acidiferrobacter sp. TaxID=1872107 RepID=UPI0026241D53|nr:exodeoxyribonuclease VII large subunit [Acidiferrobacter sp.]